MSTNAREYKVIRVDGPISIVPVTPEEVKDRLMMIYILMGPTGSGKSSFIESLAPDQHLNIAKDSLESVTQDVNCYQVVNLGTQPSYIDATFVLMDTPGFLDPRMSEGQIMKMITEHLDDFRSYTKNLVVAILYFHPITDIRISGPRRDAFKMPRQYATLYNASLAVITTMWNTLSTPGQLENANHWFEALKEGIYQHFEVTKFDTPSIDSALLLLDHSYRSWSNDEDLGNINTDHYCQSLTCDNLLGRITNLLQQLLLLAEDKQWATRAGSEDHHRLMLRAVLKDEKVALALLQTFVDDLVNIGLSEVTNDDNDDNDKLPSERGIKGLQSLLDALYDQDPGASSSPWPLSQTSPLASSIPLPADTTLQATVTLDISSDRDPAPVLSLQVPGLDRISFTSSPIPSAAQGQPPSPDTSFFAPIVTAFKRRFGRIRG